jgi:putative ABC transport system permease protein
VLEGRTPLGWLQLIHHPGRLGLAIAGVAFAVMLVFMQLGFMNMLFDSTVMLHRQLNADIVLASTKVRDMTSAGTIPRRRVIQALGVPGVADAEPLYVGMQDWIRPTDQAGAGERGQMLLLGVRPDFDAFRDPIITAQQSRLSVAGTVLFDRGARGSYSRLIAATEAGEQPTTEMSGRTVTIDGLARIGSSFGAEGVLITSEDSFFAFTRNRTAEVPSLGLIRVTPGADPLVVAARINAELGTADTRAMTMQEFVDHSRGYIARESPISFIFTFGAIIGLLVGATLVVQILAADVQDHMGEYATFKAMGFTNRYLQAVICEQSLILTVLGFVPGFLIALGFYQIIRVSLAMPVAMPLERVAMVFALTAVMCVAAGLIAMRRVRQADPAEVF